jgi:uncharacterized membrane protein YbaN (DUF454 family)
VIGAMRWKDRFKRLPRPVRLSAGIALMVLGVLGLFLPILQGFLFLSLGTIALSYDVPFFARVAHGVRAWWQRRRARNRTPLPPFKPE